MRSPATMVLRTDLSKSDIDEIAHEFSLGPVSSSYINGGARNTSYLLSGSNRTCVATVLERLDRESADAYGSFLNRVAESGLPSPPPLRTRGGSWTYAIGDKPIIVTPLVEGSDAGDLNEVELLKLGGLLARVHRSGVRCDASPVLRLSQTDVSWMTSASSDPFPQWALRQLERTADFAREQGPRAPTHGDPFRDNILVAATGALFLIDWEDAALDRPVIDLALAALAHCGEQGWDLSRVECMLAGYNSDREGDTVSLDQTLRAAAYAGLVVAYRRYRRHLEGMAPAEPYLSMWELTDSIPGFV